MKPNSSLPAPLRGIVPPLLTPLAGPESLDLRGLERLVEHMVEGGVAGLFILGTTGEGPALSYRLRREMILRTCQIVNGRLPVLVGITDTAFAESVNLADWAADAGAAAAVAAPPYYLPPGQAELLHYLGNLSARISLPLFLYNIPSLTKVALQLETVEHLMDIDRIVGIKDSSGDLPYFRQLCQLARRRTDWTVLMGPEHLLVDAVTAGGHGGVHGGANLRPRLFVDWYHAIVAQDWPRVDQLRQEVQQLGRIYEIGPHPSAIIQGLKCAAASLGLCQDELAEPFEPLGADERQQVWEILAELGLSTH